MAALVVSSLHNFTCTVNTQPLYWSIASYTGCVGGEKLLSIAWALGLGLGQGYVAYFQNESMFCIISGREDYVPVNMTAFTARSRSSFEIITTEDDVDEDPETILLRLELVNDTGISVQLVEGVVTILDNDGMYINQCKHIAHALT